MSTIDKLSESVDNGLSIAEFIQENRESIQATYGRSSIEQPSTADRTKAWELFISKNNPNNDGQEGEQSSNPGDSKAKSILPEEYSGENDRDPSNSKNPISQASACGDNNIRDAQDSGKSDGDRPIVHLSNSTSVDRRRDLDPTRAPQLKNGNEDNAQDNEQSGQHARERIRKPDDSGVRDTGARKKQSVKETTPDDLKTIMEETTPIPKRRLKNKALIDNVLETIHETKPTVKKTTDKNLQSMKLMEKHTLNHGATQDAHLSPANPKDKSVSVVNAQEDVQDVNKPENIPNTHPDVVVECNCGKDIMYKLDLILENQEKIYKRLDTVLELKEEINGIKKNLSNQSVSLSTIENYISELMIAIPRSGVDLDSGSDTKDLNPDLRMVIGRDHSRGRNELVKRYSESDKIEISDDFYNIPEIDKSYLPTGIDYKKNNAAKFVPEEGPISYYIVTEVIKKDAPNQQMADELLSLVDDSMGKIPLREIYNSIKKMLYELA